MASICLASCYLRNNPINIKQLEWDDLLFGFGRVSSRKYNADKGYHKCVLANEHQAVSRDTRLQQLLLSCTKKEYICLYEVFEEDDSGFNNLFISKQSSNINVSHFIKQDCYKEM